MKKTPEQVKKLVETYLNTECIHKFPIVEITQEVVSTYDGNYPTFIIDYKPKWILFFRSSSCKTHYPMRNY